MGLEMDVLLNRLYELRIDLPVVHTVLVRPKNMSYAYGRATVEFYQKVEGHEDESVETLAHRIFKTEKELFDRFKIHSQSTDWTLTLRGDWMVKTEKNGKLLFYRIVSLSDDNGVAMLNDNKTIVLPLSCATPNEKVQAPDPLKLPSRFQPGDTVVYHVFGDDKWISGCKVTSVTFTEGGKIFYGLDVPVNFYGLKPIYCPVEKVVSEWVVSRVGEKNPTVAVTDEQRVKTSNEH